MVTRNIPALRLVNGHRGEVSKLEKGKVTIHVLGENRTATLVPEEFSRFDATTGQCLGRRTQIPLKLCYAITGTAFNIHTFIILSPKQTNNNIIPNNAIPQALTHY